MRVATVTGLKTSLFY